MNPDKVERTRLRRLTDLPNIGKAAAEDLRLLGFEEPAQIEGACPYEMYRRLCELSGARHDPCVIDVFMSVTEFLKGGPARSWWAYTEARKAARGDR